MADLGILLEIRRKLSRLLQDFWVFRNSRACSVSDRECACFLLVITPAGVVGEHLRSFFLYTTQLRIIISDNKEFHTPEKNKERFRLLHFSNKKYEKMQKKQVLLIQMFSPRCESSSRHPRPSTWTKKLSFLTLYGHNLLPMQPP